MVCYDWEGVEVNGGLLVGISPHSQKRGEEHPAVLNDRIKDMILSLKCWTNSMVEFIMPG